LNVQALGRTFSGTIARFADRLNSETRTMRVEVDVANPRLELVPGMYASASLVLDEAKNAIIAPIQAIDRHDDSASVMVVDREGGLSSRPVALGLEAADRIEIKEGLAVGDLVVTGNRGQLKAGARVRPKLTAQSSGEGGQ